MSATLANRAAFLTLARLLNYGLMLVSPIILARVLPVEDFGHYRQFLLYVAILQSIGNFGVYDSLLYFIPHSPDSPWRLVRQSAALVFVTTSLLSIGLIVAETVSGGALLGGHLWPLVLYLMLSMNMDPWEYYLLAHHRTGHMFMYSASRLLARLVVVCTVAIVTHDVATIIWSLVALEAVRLVGACIVYLKLDRSASEPPLAEPWRAQLRFCIPSGSASMIAMLNRNLSSLYVSAMLGVAGLAQFAIGRFAEPIVTIVRNSISAVVLPEMVRRGRDPKANPLALWRRSAVMNTIFMLPVAILVGRYAWHLVTTLFGQDYAPAASVMQIYTLILVRECFDFAPALRATGTATPIVYSNLAALVVGGITMLVLVPYAGISGAMLGAVVASFVDAIWQARSLAKFHGVSVTSLIPWSSVLRTALAAGVAASVVVSPIWTDALGFAGIILACATYGVAYLVLLKLMRVPEADVLFATLRRTVAGNTGA
jgi:O-antigen/teichoic acid export membrane protein